MVEMEIQSIQFADWIDIAVALVTLFLAGIALYGNRISSKALGLQSDPYVILYVKFERDRYSLFIVAENIGKGIAKDITFKLDAQLPDHVGIRTHPDMLENSFLNNGIKSLAPNEKREIWWGGANDLVEKAPKTIINTTCSFKSATNKKMPKVENVIEVASFINHDANTTQIKEIEKKLEKISKSLAKIAKYKDN